MVKLEEPDIFAQVMDLGRRHNWDGLAETLRSSSHIVVRRRAMEILLSSRSTEAFDLLADTAAGPEVGLNEEILTELRNIPGEASLRALLARVQQEPGQLATLPRESIAGIVSFVPYECAQDLVGPDYPVLIRAEAARRLAIVGGADSVTTLMTLVLDPEPILARAAWDGLRSIQSMPATLLLPFLGDRHDEVRRQGIELFARCCGAEGAPLLAGMLKDRVGLVREAAVRATHKLLNENAIASIARLANDPELCVRRTVVELLARHKSAAEHLVPFVLGEEEELRQRATIALATHGYHSPDLSTAYLGFLELHASELKPEADIVDAMAAIAKLLGDAREPRALDGFLALCRTGSRRLRRTGIEAILAFPVEQRVEPLLTLSETHDKNMLSALALALADQGEKRAIVPLIRTYVECSGRASRNAWEHLKKDERIKDTDFLLQLLGSKAASVRRFSAGNLRTCQDARVVEPLLKVSHDEDVEVQLAAIEALGGFAKAEESVSARLIEACSQGDVTVRQAAVEALGAAKVESSVPVLIKALFNVFLRPRAEEALRNVGGRQGYLAMKRLKRREALFGNKYKRKKEKPKLKD